MTTDPHGDLSDIIDDIVDELRELSREVDRFEHITFDVALPVAGAAIAYSLDVVPTPERPPRIKASLRYSGVKIERYQRNERPDLEGLRVELHPNDDHSATFRFSDSTGGVDEAPETVDVGPEVGSAVAAATGTAAAVDYNPDLDGSRPFVDRAMAWMAEQGASAKDWGLGSEERFEALVHDQELVLHFADGRVVTLPMQVVGSWDPADGLFRWGWDHQGVPPGTARHATLVREWATENGYVELTTNLVPADIDRCWEFTSLAMWLGQGEFGYAAEANGPMVFMTLGEPRF